MKLSLLLACALSRSVTSMLLYHSQPEQPGNLIDISDDTLSKRSESLQDSPDIPGKLESVSIDDVTGSTEILATRAFDPDNPYDIEGIVYGSIEKNDRTKNYARSIAENSLFARSNIPAGLTSAVDFYLINITAGTPAQPLTALLDTGSSDLWGFAPNVANSAFPTFDRTKSSTWHENNTQFSIVYISGTCKGEWGTDSISMGSATITHQSLAVVTSASNVNDIPGLMGVGLVNGESTVVSSTGELTGTAYNNVPMSLYRQGLIRSPIFSLYLDDIETKTGGVLFGGIDTNKYTGPLYTIPRLGEEAYFVYCDGLIIGSYSSPSFNALIDSGSTLGMLPSATLKSIQSLLSLQYSSSLDYYYVTSLDSVPDISAQFSFSGALFQIPLRQLFVDSSALNSPYPSGQYVFGFVGSQAANQIILGDSFLRSFYVVYDFVNPQIGLALASFNSGDPSITVVSGNTITGSTKAPKYAQTSSLAQQAEANDQSLTSSASSANSASASASGSTTGSSGSGSGSGSTSVSSNPFGLNGITNILGSGNPFNLVSSLLQNILATGNNYGTRYLGRFRVVSNTLSRVH